MRSGLGRRVAWLGGIGKVGPTTRSARNEVEGGGVPGRPATDDRLRGDVVEVVHVPEGLAPARIREMDLDERPADGQQRVPQRDAGVGEPTGVHDRPVEVAAVEPIDQNALVVRLQAFDVQPQLDSASPESVLDLRKGGMPVDLRLARAEHVQVWSVEDEHADHDWLVSKPHKIGAVRRAAARPRSTTSGGTSERIATPTSLGSTQFRRP